MRKLTAGSCLLVLFNCLNMGSIALAQDAPKADNTAQNRGALRRDSVTAEKQGNSKRQVAVLAEIRKAIMAEKGLSMDAKNVKILCTKEGLVILRGPVDSEAEKVKVEELTKSSTGGMSIQNELTVAVKAH